MGGGSSAHGEMRNAYKILAGKLERAGKLGRDISEDLDIEGGQY
jgi:hypothetical protein